VLDVRTGHISNDQIIAIESGKIVSIGPAASVKTSPDDSPDRSAQRYGLAGTY